MSRFAGAPAACIPTISSCARSTLRTSSPCSREGNWKRTSDILCGIASDLEIAGADCIRHDLSPMIPNAQDRAAVHAIIFDELCCVRILEESRQRFIEIVERGREAGADAEIG